MGCGFCFATFPDLPPQPTDHLVKEDALGLINLVSQAGFRKINLAGGEPTLCPWLFDLIHHAKTLGLTTSVVTNGSKTTGSWLGSVAGLLDIVAVSIDSVDAEIQKKIGRVVNGKPPMSERDYLVLGEAIRERGIRLKVNTVVNRHNRSEDFRRFIRAMNPERWKIFQALPVEGQNDQRFSEFIVDGPEFDQYVARNRSVERDGIKVVPENNDLMTGSYLMIDPMGRFFDNTSGEHTYSRPILEVGVETAFGDIRVFPERFSARGGSYE